MVYYKYSAYKFKLFCLLAIGRWVDRKRDIITDSKGLTMRFAPTHPFVPDKNKTPISGV